MGNGKKDCCINISSKSGDNALMPKMCCGCFLFGCLTAVVLALVIMFFAFKSAGIVYDEAKKWLMPHADTKITTEFQTFAEKTSKANKLILLERQSKEKVTRRIKQTYSLPGFTGNFALTDQASVSIRCPVTLFYYVDLQEKWQLKLRDGRLLVQAPPIRIAPPVIDLGRVEREINGGWLIFGETAMLGDLEKGLQVELRCVAMQPVNMERYRAECRKSLEQFIRSWLLDSQHQAAAIDISFANEPEKIRPAND